MGDEDDFVSSPPPGPPPLLSKEQLLHLARQGWLSLPLPETLSSTVTDLFESSARFFDLPDQEKADLYPSKAGTEFGFYTVPNEKDYITFRCRIHSTDKESRVSSPRLPLLRTLEDNAARAWQEGALLLWRILCDITRWSDLDLSIWNDILDGCRTMPESEEEMGYTLLRLFRYLPATGFAERHTDLGLLTICIGDSGGLEVLDRFKSTNEKPLWIDSGAKPQTATILVGQTLKALSNGMLSPGVHRVVENPNGRNSAVFALRHSSKHDVNFSLFGGQGLVSASDLWKSIQVGKVNINSIKERRDAQRVKFAAERLAAQDHQGRDIARG
ncbi:uncharacterized protein Z520_03479 [Fonsecaea multimorphosa CBS 102226]|uniref:Isopenicillin N synthase-like Fe(2+) 2OG dioxygenase domain-containing protein n=1 Tax=Fonsecaea multimorphosa CBS 102226 TaxID=1442371 RepID=A0A0D2K4T4_9EURO|nr:uncharacterized protein Z520_03479 [Fonsecaea multimorphosa CBS 102226]KIY00813.1 hypothetical protein Z520_03479 [Fonsecaea multimorphosa CBS 102226]OAL27912.1 hypothetical protein AYO22_03257 [Fonsecaea multimorphosa]